MSLSSSCPCLSFIKEFTESSRQCSSPQHVILTGPKESFCSLLEKGLNGQYCPESFVRGTTHLKVLYPNCSRREKSGLCTENRLPHLYWNVRLIYHSNSFCLFTVFFQSLRWSPSCLLAHQSQWHESPKLKSSVTVSAQRETVVNGNFGTARTPGSAAPWAHLTALDQNLEFLKTNKHCVSVTWFSWSDLYRTSIIFKGFCINPATKLMRQSVCLLWSDSE